MFCCKIYLIYFFVFIRHSTCQRRIVDGKDVTSDKTYMVYLIQNSESLHHYTSWLCGGAIVHPWYILTAAACLYNMERVYVIAGINYYIADDELDKNKCAANTKRKIIRHCAPNKYSFVDFETTGDWHNLDIILGKVDRPYGVNGNEDFKKHSCPYVPNIIDVNYDSDIVEHFSDVMALGWGTESRFGESKDTNSPLLKYVVGYLMDKSSCSKKMMKYFNPKTSICFNERGSVDDQGKMLDFIEELNNGCSGGYRSCAKRMYIKREKARRVATFNTGSDEGVGNRSKLVSDPDTSNMTYIYNSRRYASAKLDNYRRFGGLCQNDHGGPLVGWIGGKEIIMGVATYFAVTKNLTCIGPSVFISTACVNKFLYCKLEQDGARRSSWCKKHNDFTEETDMPWT